MNIEVLKTFKVVMERGSLTAASRVLGLSQPAVSMQIASLEEYFGAKLLYRTARGVDLTDAGEHVLELAEKFEKSILDTQNSVAEAQEELDGVLKIAASNIPGMYILPHYVSEFQKYHPKVKVLLEIQNTRKAVDRLLSGDVHIAATGEKLNNDCIEYLPIKQDKIVLIAPKDLNVSQISCLKDLQKQKYPLIRRMQGSATFRTVNGFLKKNNINVQHLNVLSEVNSVIPQINSVVAGSGLAFVSYAAAKQSIDLQLVKIVSIKEMPLERTLYAIVKNTCDRSRVGSAFWQLLLNGGK
ncbi:LysR family transcriptional regulator [Clostridium sp. 'deep sea']|uniref:LysR family transcriptional regulator n=1 Tax=Clostridium sp. 'deep sea' TaxID=2779445 RepID=UPI0018968085|nr:LysR family transcriptional regulator [Clostridium sp. 'deep sea']QOR34312.1 LysR family transcriptional regulator [Clostridium sp. 'deep sea']